ncbi:phytanoyl-CoA dioxygenase family protein [Dactylosporangium siamense]|uniref:Phytanoyl-CoA dioxygenase n=1 Tax=Dactylosporangium siamense TaxID=685454 RepID=A0A919U956_9ACTN|nr:phytanoyl-CoA dioxygenase family protein [Dactylosporangium siamense]GIG43435.1 hypothetical protein Dsi01nite_014760 [Dactylosporangium siamense]
MSTNLRPSFALDADQLDFFDRNGYLMLRGLIPPSTIDRLRVDSEAWMTAGPDTGNLAPGVNPDDFDVAHRDGVDVPFRINYVHDKGGAASLELLGCPRLLGVAQSLAGPNFVPTYESLVFKAAGDGAPVHWHQDATHPRHWRIANLDVYLDESRPGEGALRVLPGSHRDVPDLCRLETDHGWDPPGAVEIEAHPGDVLVHDVMLVHGSPRVRGNRLRRTLYYEFRAAEQILAEGPWDAGWIERRMRLIPLALDAWAHANPAEPVFPWQADERWRPGAGADAAQELRIVHQWHSPGNYCSAGDVRPAPDEPAAPH